MKRLSVLLALMSLLLIFTGCQSDGVTVQTVGAGDTPKTSVLSEAPSPEASETPSASGETEPPSNGLFSHSIGQDGTAATLSLGMTFGEVTSLLDQAGITYSEGNHWEDYSLGDEISGISLTESAAREYLDFSEDDGTLYYIEWVLAAGDIINGDQGAFPGCVTAAINTYGFLPLYYHSESGNDSVNFPLDGGYYALFHNDYSGEVKAILSYDDPFAWSEPSEDYALLLSEDVSYAASEEAADLDTVIAKVSAEYGETDRDGNANVYTCEGIALYGQRLYYSIRWATRYEHEEGGTRTTYNEQVYVSVDGSTMLPGYYDEILIDRIA